jgi:hypothetical protein
MVVINKIGHASRLGGNQDSICNLGKPVEMIATIVRIKLDYVFRI